VGIKIRNPKTGEYQIKEMIKEMTPMPDASRKVVFYTSNDTQTRMRFEIVRTDADGEWAEESLGQLVYGPISNPKRNYPIEMSISFNEDGVIVTRALDRNTGEEVEKRFESQQAAV
jgi:molecular chaperone DnaK (HSP70)